MVWRVEFDASAEKALRNVDRAWQGRIVAYLEEISELPDPRLRGKSLAGTRSGLWRYRLGDYRIVCQVQDDYLSSFETIASARRQRAGLTTHQLKDAWLDLRGW